MFKKFGGFSLKTTLLQKLRLNASGFFKFEFATPIF